MYAVNDIEAKTACAAGGKWDGVCCWNSPNKLETNRIANPCTSSGNYETCNRVLCQYKIAEKTCGDFTYAPEGVGTLNWNLPAKNQIDYFKVTYTKAKGNLAILGVNGVYLCDEYNTVSGIQQCHGSPGCYGVPDGGCRARAIWADNGAYYLQDGVFEGSWVIGSKYYAFSARCTLDKTKLFKSYSGSGGSSGAMLSNIDITSYVKQAGKDGTIELTAGKAPLGRTGANNKNTPANNGIDGNISKILIKNKSGTIIYGLKTSGGRGGTAATSVTVSGAAAAKPAATSSCQYTINGATWQNTSCSKNSIPSVGGNIIWVESAAVGTGAQSHLTSDTSGYGAGGNGGTSSYSYNDTISSTSGANGKGGLVKITYNNQFPGAGGGGGAGGTMAKIKNLSLPSDKECIIRVGGGGNYGSGQNDKNGGNTSIKCGNAKEYIIHGGEGGKLGASGTSVTNPKPVGGSGGNRGKVSENIIQLGTLAEIIYGEGLYSGTTQETALKINGNLNIGGNGGKSRTDAIGGCGGLRPNGDPDCTNGNVNATPGEYFTPTYTGLTANTPDYGKTGAGGAGGGWNANQSPKQGTGSSEQPGYLFLWWEQE